jgi:hypothetical protein
MLRWATEASALALILAAVQGCGNSTNSGAPDASGGNDGSSDAGTEAGEAAPPGADCGSTAPSGTQVVPSTDPLVVLTMTSDDHIIYEDLASQEIYAVAAAGGKPSDIGKMTSQARTVWAHGISLLYLPSAADPQTSIAPLSVWTPSGGTSVISKSIIAVDSYDYTYDGSKDGQYVAYFATNHDQPATLTVSTTDGVTQKPLIPGIDLSDESCFPPAVQFVNDTLIAQYCTPPVATADAGTPPETTTIMAFTAPSFTPVVVGTTFGSPPGPAAVDPTGTLLLLLDPSGTGLSLYSLTGASPVTVDATGVAGLFTATGDVLYTTTSGALMRYTAATGMTTPLVSTGLEFPLDLSPDGNWVQAADKQNQTSGLTDLYIASATTAGPLTTVVSTATTSAIGFTADSNYSLFGTDFPPDFGSVTFDLEASKTSGGAAAKVIAAAGAPLVTTGSKLVCGTNQSKSTGAAEVVGIDLSTTAAPTVLVTQADPNLFLTSTKLVVYSWYCNENATAGIWTLTPP